MTSELTLRIKWLVSHLKDYRLLYGKLMASKRKSKLPDIYDEPLNGIEDYAETIKKEIRDIQNGIY